MLTVMPVGVAVFFLRGRLRCYVTYFFGIILYDKVNLRRSLIIITKSAVVNLLHNSKIERCSTYCSYLGTLVIKNIDQTREIKSRTEFVVRRNEILCYCDTNLTLRQTMLPYYVFSILLYWLHVSTLNTKVVKKNPRNKERQMWKSCEEWKMNHKKKQA